MNSQGSGFRVQGSGGKPAAATGLGRLTPAQLEAIRETGCSLLVSAAAGAGKTTVLAERCVALICDVAERERCDIDQLLVVTFTDAAAEEMRTRIRAALRRRSDERPEDERLQRQIHMLDCASISTIHAFCKTLIERYFPQAEVDPQASVLSEEEADLLRDEVMNDLFLSRYASREPEGLAFQAIVDDYGAGDDYRVGQVVRQVHDFASTLADAERWLQDALKRAETDGPESLLARLDELQWTRLETELRAQMEYCRYLAEAIRSAWPVAEMHADAVSEYFFVLKKWLEALGAGRPGCWERVAEEIRTFELGWKTRRPTGLSDEDKAAFDAAKAQRDKLREYFERRLKRRLCAFTAAEYREGLERVAPPARTLVELVREFGVQYDRAKAARAVVDFNDLQRKALRVLTEKGQPGRPSDVARHLQRRYRYVLVDEFQDVDPLQAEILRLVSREAAEPAEGNLFTVGDIKQSIYRFRLAEPALFMKRADLFGGDRRGGGGDELREFTPPGPPLVRGGEAKGEGEEVPKGGRDARPPRGEDRSALGRVIPLQHNFRSRAEVIDGINRVFETLMSREFGGSDYDEIARLHAGATYPAGADGPMFGSPAVEMHLLEPVTEQTRAAASGADAQRGEGAAATPRTPPTPPLVRGGEEGGGADEDTAEGGEALSPEEELEGIQREGYLIGRLVRHWMGLGTQGKRFYVAGKPETPGGEPVARPIEYRDIVILLRSLRFKAEPIADVLRRMGVPVRVERQAAGLDTTEFRDCVNVLRLLDNAQQDIPLAAVMRSPILGAAFNETELLKIRLVEREGPFHAAVRKYAVAGEDTALRQRLIVFLGIVDRLRTRIQRTPVADVLWEIYEASGYLALVCGLPDGMRRREHLVRLHELARQFGRFSRQGLRRFLHFIDELAERERQPRQAGIGGDENCVRIMTVHASKGLEFPVVVLADLQKRFNLEDTRGAVLVDRRYGIALRACDPEKRILYPTLAHQLAVDETIREGLSEELRVLYVAMTRAREHLVLIGRTPLTRVELTRAMQTTRHSPPPSPPYQGGETMRAASTRAALPRLQLESAACALDWLMAAVGAAPAEEVHWKEGRERGGQGLFEISTYSRAATDQWEIPPAVVPAKAEALAKIARLDPLPADEPVEAMDEAQKLLAALGEKYPAPGLTTIPGRLAVGELKRRWDVTLDVDERTPPARRLLEPPRPLFVTQAAARDPVARGSATHRFLQLLDLTARCDTADLQRQLERFVDQGRMAEEDASGVLVEAVAWLLGSELGQRIRANSARVQRELAFDARIAPERYDPRVAGRDARDVILVRGVVDLLMETDAGLEIVDYKTDVLAAGATGVRADAYRPQLDIYATAMDQIYRRPVVRRWLVFLHPRVIVTL